jgi:uncharacterized protein (TIGR02302 family)
MPPRPAAASVPPSVLAAKIVLWIEALTLAAWPASAALATLLAIGLLGLPALLPAALRIALLAAAAAALVLLVASGAARFRRPEDADAERRLEQDSGLLHRPFATLRDAPAETAQPAQLHLWRLHQLRARAAIAGIRLGPPRPLLAMHDPFALRAAALLVLVSAAIIAGPQAPGRLAAFLFPGLPDVLSSAHPTIQAWLEPPAYTGLPPIFLPPAGGDVTAPTGSRLTISITGVQRRPALSIAGHAAKLEPIGADSFSATAALTSGGIISIDRFFSTLASWHLTLLPNEAPVAGWPALPGRAGTSLSTKLPWQVQQRWGVAALLAELRPQGHPALPPLVVPVPLPGTPKSATGSATTDLSANPYAGLTMTGRLVARDVSGQTGQSPPVDFVLPARTFRHPLARAIADLRRRLALNPDHPQDAADDLTALAEAPQVQPVRGLAPAAITLNMAAIAAVLTPDPNHPQLGPAAIAQAQGRLWTLALALDGALPDASARALAEAREDLKHALDDRTHGRLTDRDLAKRLDALRQALDKRLSDIARQAMQKGAIQKFDPNTQHLSSPAMDRAIRELRKALEEGRMADARDRMAELERMMDQLNNAHIMTQEEARQQREQAKRGRQQMGAAQDLVQRESKLLDHAQGRAPNLAPQIPGLPQFQNFDFNNPQGNGDRNMDPGAPDPGTQDPTESQNSLGSAESQPGAPPSGGMADSAPATPQTAPAPPAKPTQAQDARTQRALHRALDALKDTLAQSGHQPPHSLDDASQAMQDAARALAEREDPAARDAIARAIAALQQGAQDMSRQMGRQSGSAGMQLSLVPGGQAGQQGDEGSDDPGDGQGGHKRDPFGRQVDGNGTTADDPDLRVPDEMEQGRSRAIQEELRRRGADRARPKGELDYIDRLLKPF